MFERYSERARRVIFFARYEASQFGSTTIETEHFLLGLIREDGNLLRRFLAESKLNEAIRKEIEAHIEHREKTSTSHNLPLSDECKRILGYAAEESERLADTVIAIEHQLLGILREESCFAAQVLKGLGMDLSAARGNLARTHTAAIRPDLDTKNTPHFPEVPNTPLPAAGVVPDAETAKRIAEAVWLGWLSSSPGDEIGNIQAELKFGVWIVEATHTRNNIHSALAAFIKKEDGTILRLHQEKAGS